MHSMVRKLYFSEYANRHTDIKTLGGQFLYKHACHNPWYEVIAVENLCFKYIESCNYLFCCKSCLTKDLTAVMPFCLYNWSKKSFSLLQKFSCYTHYVSGIILRKFTKEKFNVY